jgi:hypothetical protein
VRGREAQPSRIRLGIGSTFANKPGATMLTVVRWANDYQPAAEVLTLLSVTWSLVATIATA